MRIGGETECDNCRGGIMLCYYQWPTNLFCIRLVLKFDMTASTNRNADSFRLRRCKDCQITFAGDKRESGSLPRGEASMEGHKARKSTHTACLGRSDESRSTRLETTSPDHMTISVLQLAVLFIYELVFPCHGLQCLRYVPRYSYCYTFWVGE